MRSVAIAFFCSLCFVVGLAAQDKSAAPKAPNPPPAFDQQKAFEQWQQQMQQQMLSQFDVDKNGVLSDQEKMMAQEAMRRQGVTMPMAPGGFPGADQFNKQFDRDGDGKLNPQEAMAAQAAFQRMRGNGSGMRGGLNNGGGGGAGASGVNPQQPIAPPNAGDGKASKVSPLVKRFDKDGDGKLNADEKAAAQAELKKDKGKEKDAKAKDKDAKPKE